MQLRSLKLILMIVLEIFMKNNFCNDMEKIIKVEDSPIDIKKLKKLIIYEWEEIYKFNYK